MSTGTFWEEMTRPGPERVAAGGCEPAEGPEMVRYVKMKRM